MCSSRHCGWRHRLTCLQRHGQVSLLYHHLGRTDDYIPWFLSCTHPRIQNPERRPCSIQLPTATPISLQVLVDMISREKDRDDVDSDTKIGWIFDMLKKYNQPRQKI
ncbi:hypothetical protein M9H77_09495 [Catharanthus roseus]|uniref:Uncharacterized protein n=1 Tax=Catharanthus roseus TaxID=4058 RepID=A0ACC0C0T9_CATRO|nr:hypothetical protein M9H77_09495 [Catharanthus roseus]